MLAKKKGFMAVHKTALNGNELFLRIGTIDNVQLVLEPHILLK